MDDASVRLLARWRQGDEQAATELFHRYAERLMALAGSRLASKLAGRVDPEDVVQSAYRSFFAGARQGHYRLQQGGDLWRLLVNITLHKLQDQIKHHTAGKRSVYAEHRFGTADRVHGIPLQLLAQSPSPIAAASLSEEVEHWMRSVPSDERPVIELRLQGYTLYEIAEQTGWSLATVCRILDRLKQRLSWNCPTTGGQPRHDTFPNHAHRHHRGNAQDV